MWEFVKTGTEVDCELFGIKIFDHQWESTGQKIEVADPVYGQLKILTVYNVTIKNTPVTFASGEFSNGVYAFYTKK